MTLKGGKMGILSDKTGLWMLEPKYRHVEMISRTRVDLFWAQDYSIHKSKWFVVDSTGKQVTEPIFDEKFRISGERSWNEFRSDYKTGFVSDQFVILIPAIFNRQVRIDRKTVYVSGQEAYFQSYKTGKAFQIKHDLVNEDYPGGHLFLFNDSIQLLGQDGEEILSATAISEVVSTVNLRKLLYPETTINRSTPFISGGQIHAGDADSVLWMYNNQILLDRAKRNTIALKRFSSEYEIPKVNDTCRVEPFYLGNKLYSERISGNYYTHPSAGLKSQSFSYRNYLISSNELRQIELKDLFSAGYEPKLNELIQQTIQKNQIYGNSCPDMPRAIAEFKVNFYFRGKNLVFYNYALQRELVIELSVFKDILKPEFLFGIVVNKFSDLQLS